MKVSEKKLTLKVVGFVFCAGMLGCAAYSQYRSPLSTEGQGVKLIKSDPDNNCTEAGSVIGRGITDEFSKNSIRNEAASRGANLVRLETVKTGEGVGVIYSGTAFKCPQ